MSSIYQTAHESAVFFDQSHLGVLKFTGESRLDLIDRMSTNLVRNLQKGEGAATIFTSEIGRMMERIILYATSDFAYAITSENNGDNVARYLMRFVFFNDDFQVQDLSAGTAVYAVYGPKAQEALAEVGFTDTDFPLHHWRHAEIDGMTAYLHKTDPIAGDGYFITCNMDVNEAIEAKLKAVMPQGTQEEYEYLRIEQGIGRFRREWKLDYIPLEANLKDDISFHKGCYIGQEIIARMESRGKLAKKLVGFTSEKPLAEGAEIMADGKSVGTVTSSANVDGLPTRALGYVKTKALESGTPLMVGDSAISLN